MSRTVNVTVTRPDPEPARRKNHSVRSIIARALAGSDAETYGRARWGDSFVARAGVGAVGSDPLVHPGAQDDQFFGAVFERPALAQLPGLRIVDFNTRLLRMTSGATGFWVAESKATPVASQSILGSILAAARFSAMMYYPKEMLENAHPATEARFSADLENAVVGAIDTTAFDLANDGSSGAPASLTNGAPAIASSGNPATDIATLVSLFSGDLRSAAFVTHPTVAAGIALARDAAGAFIFPNAGPAGGSILNLPLITSRHVPEALILIDGSGIAARIDGVQISRSRDAMIEADTLPTGDAEAPTAATATRISLFANDLIALHATISANWEDQRGSVVVATGCDYVALVS